MSSSETNSSDFLKPGCAFLHTIGDLLGYNGQSNTFSRLKDAIMQDSDSDDSSEEDLFQDVSDFDPHAALEGYRFDRAVERYPGLVRCGAQGTFSALTCAVPTRPPGTAVCKLLVLFTI